MHQILIFFYFFMRCTSILFSKEKKSRSKAFNSFYSNLFIIEDVVILLVMCVTHRSIDVFSYDTDYIVLNRNRVDNDMFDLIMCGV